MQSLKETMRTLREGIQKYGGILHVFYRGSKTSKNVKIFFHFGLYWVTLVLFLHSSDWKNIYFLSLCFSLKKCYNRTVIYVLRSSKMHRIIPVGIFSWRTQKAHNTLQSGNKQIHLTDVKEVPTVCPQLTLFYLDYTLTGGTGGNKKNVRIMKLQTKGWS